MSLNCFASSIVGIGLVGATISTMTVSKDDKNEIVKTLSPDLADKYLHIAAERRNIYLAGLALGLVCAFALVKFISANWFYKTTLSLATVIGISVLVYILTPKSDYMLNHLKTPEQTRAWLKVYRNMKYRYYLGFALGSLTALPLAWIGC